MSISTTTTTYFPCALQLSARARHELALEQFWPALRARRYPPIIFFRRLAAAIQQLPAAERPPVSAGQLVLYATLLNIFRFMIDNLDRSTAEPLLAGALRRAGLDPQGEAVNEACRGFVTFFPPEDAIDLMSEDQRRYLLLREQLLLRLAAGNRAVEPFRWLLDDSELSSSSPYPEVAAALERGLSDGPMLEKMGVSLVEALRAPLLAAPDSLEGQLGFIREKWGAALPSEMLEELLTSFDILVEEWAQRGGGGNPGSNRVLKFRPDDSDAHDEPQPGIWAQDPGHVAGYDQPEYEAFSPDADWMSNVVLMAKMTHVWLDQLSKSHDRPITRLDQVPDAELDLLAERGFTGLWLIGLWERSTASRRIKELCGNPEAHASAYSLYDYTIAEDLGGETAFLNLKARAWLRGIRLASDMVPNHTGIYSRWVIEHPDWFVQTDYPPFPTYRFNGEDLSREPAVTLQIDDGYWSKDDAAVCFRMIDRRDGRTRYLYHGNDGTSIPWNDTAQLNYLIPEVREAVMQTILHVARLTPIIRFDAAMTLAKKHYQRLWFPQRGLGGGIPSRAEHAMSRDEFDAVFPQEFWREVVDRVSLEVPDTLLLAEAFWMMEGYFVRTLGMHRVYNSAFMNMIKTEENAKYRQTIKNVLEFNPEILKRFVNFMNNPDEKTAVEQFGSQGKYFGACVLMSTMPGLPMFGHGQIEGYREKYGMEYRRAYWDEQPDAGLLEGHRLWIFPLLKRRWLFSGSEHFALFEFRCHDGNIDENVFAYSNRSGDQRALVLYNNRYGATSGWVYEAAAVALKDASGETTLRTGNLADALGVLDDPALYLAFRDLSSGLMYLRNCRELHEKGLYAELGEYEFHVFWDLQELRDGADEAWKDLCAELNGSGVESLDDELVQLRNRPLINAFSAVVEAVAALTPGDDLQEDSISTVVEKLLAELPVDVTTSPIDQSVLYEALSKAHDSTVARKTVRKLRAAGVSRHELPSSRLERRMLLAVLLIRALLPGLGNAPLEQYGLHRPLTRFLADDIPQNRTWGAGQAESCSVVAAAWHAWAAPIALDDLERLMAVLALPEVKRFLIIHDDGGITWFNKERFEELFNRLALMSAFEMAADLDVPDVPVKQLKLFATGAGYRLRGLLHLAQELAGTI